MDFSQGFGFILLTIGQCLLITIGVLLSLAFLMYADRKIWAAVQMRKGPNVVGAFGILQSFADLARQGPRRACEWRRRTNTHTQEVCLRSWGRGEKYLRRETGVLRRTLVRISWALWFGLGNNF